MWDFLIVGAGLFGSIFARRAAAIGKRCLIIDRRPHIAGNCYTEDVGGIKVHRYGPHIFHTANERVWNFVRRFVPFNNFQLHTKVSYRERLFSFPINLMTLHQLWGVRTPEEALRKLEQVRVPSPDPGENLETWILSQVGHELYETFIKGYTTKQWGREPRELPSFIIRRLPIRLTYDDRYFDDPYEGIPIGGYTRMFENLLDDPNIRVELNTDFFANRAELERGARRVVYTGMIDEYFDYCFGELEYRSLRFEMRELSGDLQGTPIVNYTEREIPHTRIVEHKHFEFQRSDRTVVTWEYPDAYARGKVPYYPIQDRRNKELYERYKELAAAGNVIFGGRLGTYQYYDMHQVVAQALTMADTHLGKE